MQVQHVPGQDLVARCRCQRRIRRLVMSCVIAVLLLMDLPFAIQATASEEASGQKGAAQDTLYSPIQTAYNSQVTTGRGALLIQTFRATHPWLLGVELFGHQGDNRQFWQSQSQQASLDELEMWICKGAYDSDQGRGCGCNLNQEIAHIPTVTRGNYNSPPQSLRTMLQYPTLLDVDSDYYIMVRACFCRVYTPPSACDQANVQEGIVYNLNTNSNSYSDGEAYRSDAAGSSATPVGDLQFRILGQDTPVFASPDSMCPKLLLETTPYGEIVINQSTDLNIDVGCSSVPWTSVLKVHTRGDGWRAGRSLLRFDLNGVPPDADVQSATLALKAVYETEYATATVYVSRVTENWSPIDASWYQRLYGVRWTTPGATMSSIDQAQRSVPTLFTSHPNLGVRDDWVNWDVTDIVTAWRGGAPNYGFCVWQPIIGNNDNQQIGFASASHGLVDLEHFQLGGATSSCQDSVPVPIWNPGVVRSFTMTAQDVQEFQAGGAMVCFDYRHVINGGVVVRFNGVQLAPLEPYSGCDGYRQYVCPVAPLIHPGINELAVQDASQGGVYSDCCVGHIQMLAAAGKVRLIGSVIEEATGVPVRDASVAIIPETVGRSVAVDDDGRWTMDVPVGRGYQLNVSSPTHEPRFIKDLDYSAAVVYPRTDVLRTRSYEAFRVREYLPCAPQDTVRMCQGGAGFFWCLIEGLREGHWERATDISVQAIGEDEAFYQGRTGIMQSAFVSEPISLNEPGLVSLRIPAGTVGDGTANASEVIRIVAANGVSIAEEHQPSFRALVEPYRYSAEWGYRIFGKGGVGATSGLLSASGFAGGGSGASLGIDLEESEPYSNWHSFHITRRNDVFLGARVEAGPPKLIDIGQSWGASVGVKASFPYGEEYHFDLNTMTGVQPLTALYLLTEPVLLYGARAPAFSTQFLYWMVKTIIEAASDHFVATRYSDLVGVDLEGAGSADVGLGMGTISRVQLGAGVGLGGEAHAGATFSNTVDGTTERSIYVSGTLSGSVGPRVLSPTDGAQIKRFLPMNMEVEDAPWKNLLLSGSMGANYELKGNWKNGQWKSTTFTSGVSSEVSLLKSLTVPGTTKEYASSLTIRDQAANGVLLNCGQLPSDVQNVGSQNVNSRVDNETFKQTLTNYLSAVNRAQELMQPTTVGYECTASGTDRFDLDIELKFPIPAMPALNVSIGQGVESEAVKKYDLGEGRWVSGQPLFQSEMPNLPTESPSLDDVVGALWDRVKNGESGASLRQTISSSWRQVCFFCGKSLEPLSPLGSTLNIVRAAIPAGVDSARSIYWEWGGGATKDKNTPGYKVARLRAYSRYLRSVREAIVGMHYGVGGFYKFEPDSVHLLQPATLTICYADSEVVGIDEATLAVYRQDTAGGWIPISSVAYPDSNRVVASVVEFGTYTLAPRMPSGGYQFHALMDSIPADGTSTVFVVSDAVRNDDGTAVLDGALFTVSATLGAVVAGDADPDRPGIQVWIQNGKLSAEFQAGAVSGTATVSASSVDGYATVVGAVRMYDVCIPGTPLIVSMQPTWQGFQIQWTPPADVDVAGYSVYYGCNHSGPPYDGRASVWGKDSPIVVGNVTSVTVDELLPGTTYYVAVSAVDASGKEGPLSQEAIVIATSVNEGPDVPRSLALGQNYPNPFNPITAIRYGIPGTGRASIRIYDVKGRLVRVLMDEAKAGGTYEVVWRADDDHGRRVASGLYYYVLTAGGKALEKKMVLVR